LTGGLYNLEVIFTARLWMAITHNSCFKNPVPEPSIRTEAKFNYLYLNRCDARMPLTLGREYLKWESVKDFVADLSPSLDPLISAMQHLSIKVRYMEHHPIKPRVPLFLSRPANLFPFHICIRTPKAELSLFKLVLG